ncbi:DNA-binding response regulator, OmpR family, contains REC and winged-helix (wHTH) domain [Lachnospiraceae bacterium NE2001]|nr:DNA-binding response regulator, OmpR family, contains REC and winged-helix (wHTH) domain [Lachnospiraceae bacterium NE2001]
MIKILVVEDEKPISNLIRMSLKGAGYTCDQAFDGNEALDKIDETVYDLILLDIMLPEVDGFELMEYIKPLGVPVIFLTAKDALDDRVKGLKMGAEDYIVKPFEVAELIARVEVVLRRYKKTEDTFELNGLYVDASSMVAKRGDKEIPLTPKEFDLLLLFLRTPNTALYRENIYEKVWGGELEYGSKTVDLHVQRLRKKAGLEKELKSVSKVGYRLDV